MRTITEQLFSELVTAATIRPRLKREVRFSTSVAGMTDEDWANTELFPITTRAENRGIVLLSGEGDVLRAVGYELSRGITSSTGRAQPIICDFCRTWQTGSRSGSITLYRPGRDAGSVTFLCCADLQCSRHVRSLTDAARTSRAQLREDMDTEQRIARLRARITEIIDILDA